MPENPSNSSEPISNENVARILALLRTGDEKIGSTRIDNAILIVGKSGSGKTTLTNFLAGNNADLISEELGQDTGEFIIRDKGNKISDGNSTIISKTIFPELIYDRETKTAYIDCPGFNDRGRNEAYDIAAAYFIKKVLENVKNIKIVLTANYPSLQSGVSRDDFPHLLERVTTLIKNIDKYVDSVALVATKVYNTYTRRKVQGKVDLVLVPDRLVIENIAKFLLQVEQSLKNMQTSEPILKSNSTLSQDRAFFTNSRKLLDALLQKKGTEYTRLGLFRRPDVVGPVSEIELLQDGKTILKNMLKNNLEYAPVDVASIGYAVSDKSKNIIRDLVEEINKSVMGDMSQIKDILIYLFKRLENDFYDDSIFVLKEHLEAWSVALAKISAIAESANSNELVSLIENNFPESCNRASEPILDDMKKLGKFVSFLQDVSGKQFDSFAWKWVGELREAVDYIENSLRWYNFLIALYERLSDYDIQKDVERFHVPNFDSASPGQLENFPDFSKFFNEISNSRILKVQYLKELQKVTIDDIKVRYFNQVIESTLRRPLSFSSVQSPGPRLKVTGEYVKISDVIRHNLYPECKSVQVLATHTVFIDADMTKENDISIVAPRWVIVGFRVINLNGSPAENWFRDKALECGYSGCDGLNGWPGQPGRSAGHFFGLGDEFENASQLQIQAVGGIGGMGQRGGDGNKGASGSTYNIGESERYLYCSSGQICSTRVSFRQGDFWSYWDMYLTIYGSAGERGGDAGRGGAPGLGGFGGNITLIGVGNEKPSVLQKVAKGNDGEYGLHGKCGEGGRGGYNSVSRICVNCNHRNKDSTYSDGKQPDGDKGTCLYYSSEENSNRVGRRSPAAIDFLYSPAWAISDLRNELVKNFDNCVRKSHSMNFYKMLHKEEILNYDNVELIISEFQAMEQYRGTLQPNLSKQLYEHVLQRIKKISKSTDEIFKNGERLELLSFAASSKLTGLEKNSPSRLMFNYREYSEILKNTNLKQIDNFFLRRIRKEIKLAENLIEIVTSDISKVIEGCIHQISSFSSNGNPDTLERQLLKLKLFSKFKTVGELLSFVASLANVDYHMGKINDALSVHMHLGVVDGIYIKAQLATIAKPFEKMVDAIENAIFNEIRSLKSLGDEFDLDVDRLQDVVINLKSHLSVFDEPQAFPEFPDVSNEMKTINKINFALLENSSPKINETVDKFENDMKIIRWNVDLFGASTTEEFDRSSVTSSIDNILEKGTRIDEIAYKIIDSLFVVRNNAKLGLTLNILEIDTERIGILFKKISDHLDSTKLQFHELVAQIGIDEDLQTIAQIFDPVLDHLSTTFNEVLHNQQRRTFSNEYHPKVNWVQKSTYELQDNYLTKVASADALLYAYEQFVEVCRLSIFPFDILTNNELSLPATPFVDRSSERYQSVIASNVKQLETELESWEQRIQNVTIAEEFNSGNENEAFFVWSSDQYKESISKLLRGRAVAFEASRDFVDDKRQWLKFDNIGLRFASTNWTVQQSLDEDLKYFNVSMTHMGDSHFSLCNRVRLVHHDATQFSHSFNETITRVLDPINNPLKPVLSPFATWMLKLHPVDEDVNFSILNRYRKLPISIELEGNATFIDSVNAKMCQKIVFSDFDTHQLPPRVENDQDVAKNIAEGNQSPSVSLASDPVTHQLVYSTETSPTYPNIIESSSSTANNFVEESDEQELFDRKKRDVVGSPIIKSDNREFNWWNPLNYFSSFKSDLRSELPVKTQLLGRYEAPPRNFGYSPSLNINGALTLIDFVVRNFTKIKPHQSMEKSVSVEEARVIALNIIEELEYVLNQLPEERRISLSDWEEKDPVELVGQLEKSILTGDLSSVKEILFGLVPLDIPDDELDSLLGRHLGGAEIRGNFENHRNTVLDGRDRLPGVLNIDSIGNQAGIPVVNESLNRTMLN